MRPALSRRIARALDVGGATYVQRRRIVSAAEQARTFGALPADIRALIRRLETPPTQAR